jgi:hypothetical protein
LCASSGAWKPKSPLGPRSGLAFRSPVPLPAQHEALAAAVAQLSEALLLGPSPT